MYEAMCRHLRSLAKLWGVSTPREAADAIEELSKRPEIPATGIGDLSDGYHTFNSLYFQRLVLFAALVKAYKDRAWKSWKHEDGEPCFGGGWFIVGIDTPHGSYTYHYEGKDFDLFECEELPVAKHWDGHTEANVTRMLSLPDVVERKKGKWEHLSGDEWICNQCGFVLSTEGSLEHPLKDREKFYCEHCGADMREDAT